MHIQYTQYTYIYNIYIYTQYSRLRNKRLRLSLPPEHMETKWHAGGTSFFPTTRFPLAWVLRVRWISSPSAKHSWLRPAIFANSRAHCVKKKVSMLIMIFVKVRSSRKPYFDKVGQLGDTRWSWKSDLIVMGTMKLLCTMIHHRRTWLQW